MNDLHPLITHVTPVNETIKYIVQTMLDSSYNTTNTNDATAMLLHDVLYNDTTTPLGQTIRSVEDIVADVNNICLVIKGTTWGSGLSCSDL